jgi:hypothetical protein
MGSMLETPSEIAASRLKTVEYGSDEYNQTAMLRYRLFYSEHHIQQIEMQKEILS